MVKKLDALAAAREWCKNVPHEDKSVRSFPSSAVLAELVRPLEYHLRERNFLSHPEETSFYPLWFLAETEQNVFLWRSGLSLADKERFEFWIDVDRLISKRFRQLEQFERGNPFHSPEWDLDEGGCMASGGERAYLAEFQSCFRQLRDHAHALCRVAATLRSETPAIENRKAVLLPAAARETPQR